jgi:hypothetical protein
MVGSPDNRIGGVRTGPARVPSAGSGSRTAVVAPVVLLLVVIVRTYRSAGGAWSRRGPSTRPGR